MKVLLMTLPERVRRFYDITTLPMDWELVFAGFENNVDTLMGLGGDADVIFVDAMQPVPNELIDRMPNLKMIHSEGVGYDWIDTAFAKEKGIYVCNNAAANSKAVAEQAVMLMLAVLRRTVEGHSMVLQARQLEAKSQWSLLGIRELWNCHVGLIGMGAIGKETAKRLIGFECKVSYFSRTRLSKEQERELGVEYLELPELLKACDIISLHLPSNAETKNFMDREKLQKMKPTAILINTARGEIVNQQDLIDAIKDGVIHGAGLDTITPEPVKQDNSLINLPAELYQRITLAPHIGGVTEQAFYQMHRFVWANIKRIDEGQKPLNIVNGL